MSLSSSSCKVCVTGGAGYIGSSLVKKLLSLGFYVHATLRNLNDCSKVELLKSFEGAEERLKLFEADIYKAEEFEAAIQGCEFIFHVATPLLHTQGHKHRNRVDATVDASRSIASACVRSSTVKRLIYTASVMAASPLKDDDQGSDFKDVMDETCWTPYNSLQLLSLPCASDFILEYTAAKTLAEKELLNSFGNSEMEVVTLGCGLVGGDTLQPHLSGSMTVILSQLTNDETALDGLKWTEATLAKIPIVHIEDAINAHIFCLNQTSMTGRYLCANGYVSAADIARYYQEKYPEFSVRKEHLEACGSEHGRTTKWGSCRLTDKGFEYQHGWERVLDDCIKCARKLEHGGGVLLNCTVACQFHASATR